VFEKHLYGRERKRTLKLMDPRPAEYHNTAKDLLKGFLGKVKGKGLGVSLLLDPDFDLKANFSGNPFNQSCRVRPSCNIESVSSRNHLSYHPRKLVKLAKYSQSAQFTLMVFSTQAQTDSLILWCYLLQKE
jgi:hypothetical protein